MAGAELSTTGKSKKFLSLDIARDSESLKLDRFINLLFSVLVLSAPLLPILRNKKKGKGKWCKWCVNNTCVWSKANSWFGLCVFIKRTKFAQIVVTLFSYEGKTGFICFCLLSMKNRLTSYFVCIISMEKSLSSFCKRPDPEIICLSSKGPVFW